MSNQIKANSGKNARMVEFLKSYANPSGGHFTQRANQLKSSESDTLVDLNEGNMVDAFRVMDRNGKASTNGKIGVIWEGIGSSTDWMIASSYIKRNFEAKGVWNMVDPTQGQPPLVGDQVEHAVLLEHTFVTPEPDEPDFDALTEERRTAQINEQYNLTMLFAVQEFPLLVSRTILMLVSEIRLRFKQLLRRRRLFTTWILPNQVVGVTNT